jgi:hypothetical protein
MLKSVVVDNDRHPNENSTTDVKSVSIICYLCYILHLFAQCRFLSEFYFFILLFGQCTTTRQKIKCVVFVFISHFVGR